MARVSDAAVYGLAAVTLVAMVASVMVVTRDRERKFDHRIPTPKAKPVPIPMPTPVPTPTPKPKSEFEGDVIAPSREEKVPPVPMPGWPGQVPGLVPTSQEKYGNEEIDKAAVKASLAAVPYKDCGEGGAGKVQITFGRTGHVMSAVVTSGDYDGATKTCLQDRFTSAHVPSYDGPPKSFAWSINL